jgi:hypothetical protein
MLDFIAEHGTVCHDCAGTLMPSGLVYCSHIPATPLIVHITVPGEFCPMERAHGSILVTGSSGLVGRLLRTRLLNDGFPVRIALGVEGDSK